MSADTTSDNGVIIDESAQRAPLTATADELQQMLHVIEHDILPITEKQVKECGNKVFGAAVLDAKFQTVLADSNAETTCPLFHGEVKVIYEWSKQTPASQRGTAARNAIFLATHEPCCMCISSILWAGFPRVYYLFPYTITAAQGIPHDINTMHELWGVPSYRKHNKYLSTACILDLIQDVPDATVRKSLQQTADRLTDKYDVLSNQYHSEKANNTNNSLVLG